MENKQNAQPADPANRPASREVVARYHLPDDWSGKGACPVCRIPGRLSVQHQDLTPDRMVCGACGTAFEVENAGTRIHLAAVPPALADLTAGLPDAWLTPAELLLLLERATPASPESPFEPVAAALAHSPARLAPAVPPTGVPPSAAGSPARAGTAPLSSRPPNGAQTSPDAEPGTEDWFASLAAVLGGTLPVNPPPDDVLADELERALLGRPDDVAMPPVVGAGDLAGPLALATSLAPAAPAEPRTAVNYQLPMTAPASPEPRTANQVLAAAIAALSAPPVPAARPAAAPPVTVAPAVPSALASVTPPAALPGGSPPAATAVSAEPTPNSPFPTAPAATPAPAATALVPVAPNIPARLAPPVIAGPPPARRDLAERAWKLHELGNSNNSIRAMLDGSGGSAEDIDVIMGKLEALEQARRARFQRTMQWVLVGGLVVVFVLLAIALILSSLAPPSAPAAAPTAAGSAATALGTPNPADTTVLGTPTLAYNPIIALFNSLLPGDVKIANGPTPTAPVLVGVLSATATLAPPGGASPVANSSGLPSWVATLVPNGITIINVPTPSVDPKGPPASPCPTTGAQASALFGGPAASWSFNHQEQGWILILADRPTSIRIPTGMSAGYLVIGESLEMRSTLGPATINNVNFIAVSCN